MGIRLNREIKAYCPNFKPVRSLLRGLEAVFIEVKHQTDFFLPPAARRKRRWHKEAQAPCRGRKNGGHLLL